MELSREYPLRRHGLLYPMMVIAAIAVIVFSIFGIAAVSGWMPSSLLGGPPAAQSGENGGTEPRSASAPEASTFRCAECGVIETVREIERQGSLASVSLFPHARPALARAATW
jgi:hypothetical protein